MTEVALLDTEFERNDLFFSTPQAWRGVTTPRVVIVEDDEDVLHGWSVLLRHHGYDIRSAPDGASGLDQIEDQQPDVALLDLGLPGMHGFKVLHEIRMRCLTTKVIVITATASPEVEQRVLALGAAAMLAKPAGAKELIEVIESVLD